MKGINKMTSKVVISEQFRNYLEGLNREKMSRANLLVFMLTSDMDNEDMFKKIQSEHLEFFIKYELSKRKLEEIYLRPSYEKGVNWKLDFRSKEVTIYE